MSTTHEEAGVILAQQAVMLAKIPIVSLKGISDDTDIFVLLLHYYFHERLDCDMCMVGPASSRSFIDIRATVQKHSVTAQLLLLLLLLFASTFYYRL